MAIPVGMGTSGGKKRPRRKKREVSVLPQPTAYLGARLEPPKPLTNMGLDSNILARNIVAGWKRVNQGEMDPELLLKTLDYAKFFNDAAYEETRMETADDFEEFFRVSVDELKFHGKSLMEPPEAQKQITDLQITMSHDEAAERANEFIWEQEGDRYVGQHERVAPMGKGPALGAPIVTDYVFEPTDFRDLRTITQNILSQRWRNSHVEEYNYIVTSLKMRFPVEERGIIVSNFDTPKDVALGIARMYWARAMVIGIMDEEGSEEYE